MVRASARHHMRGTSLISSRPVSITALTCGCTLLFAGSCSDVIGSKFMYLLGTLLQAVFALGAGLSENSFQFILFRGLGGVALAFCLPSATSIIKNVFYGKTCDLAFTFLGAGQPIGFSGGLVLGGILTSFASWRIAFYIGSVIISMNAVLAIWIVPNIGQESLNLSACRRKLVKGVDWIGITLASVSITLSSYVFAVVTGRAESINAPANVAMLNSSILLVPIFIGWEDRQARLGRPAVIPNSLWFNRYFSVVCLTVFLAWGTFNGLESMFTLYFQEAQQLDVLQTSLRFLPSGIGGLIIEIIAGSLVRKLSAHYLVSIGLLASSVAPFLMTFATASSSYWHFSFVANLLNPIGADCLFTAANLYITASFPDKTQAIAGGVFNTVSQVGKAFGIAIAAVVASTVTSNSEFSDKHNTEALMRGYHASFQYMTAVSCITVFIALIGLRGIGIVGHRKG